MNTTKDQTFAYQCPATDLGLDLRTGMEVSLRKPRLVGPQETVVLFNPKARV
ncbi:hypothetical protein J7E29_09940 [Streptomyces sp. ISL-90]|nr:hypothetical protein [Streptomyces sp. ISL-90]